MRRAYIADDESAFRGIVRKMAEMHDWAVTECATGEQLLQGLDSAPPDESGVIFLDIQMPGMDGIETISELATVETDCTIYLMTGGSAANAEAARVIGNARGLNISEVLTKPIPLKDLGKIFQASA